MTNLKLLMMFLLTVDYSLCNIGKIKGIALLANKTLIYHLWLIGVGKRVVCKENLINPK